MKAITVEEKLDGDVPTFSAIASDYEEERARELAALVERSFAARV